MARGVNNVNAVLFFAFCPRDRRVLLQDGDTALFFQFIGIHGPVKRGRVLTQGARLLQQLVNQCGFTMVNMGDDGDISKVIYHDGFQIR